MEDRIQEFKEMVRKRGQDPLDREGYSNDIPEYLRTGLDLRKAELGVDKQWILLSAALHEGLQSDDLQETIEEIKEMYEEGDDGA